MTLRISVPAGDGRPAEDHAWIFARSVLVEAMVFGYAGDGNVIVSAQSSDAFVDLTLVGEAGEHTCLIAYATVAEMLTEADAVVANESDCEDTMIGAALDRALEDLLG